MEWQEMLRRTLAIEDWDRIALLAAEDTPSGRYDEIRQPPVAPSVRLPPALAGQRARCLQAVIHRLHASHLSVRQLQLSRGGGAALPLQVNDLLHMVLAPARVFEDSGLRGAAGLVVREAFVSALTTVVVEYARAVVASCGTPPSLPACPLRLIAGMHLTHKRAVETEGAPQPGLQTFSAEAERIIAAQAPLPGLIVRLNTLDTLVDRCVWLLFSSLLCARSWGG
eukprot:COSAG01_NODE_1398_length_10466_cov_173.518086_9_plen_225_part_00